MAIINDSDRHVLDGIIDRYDISFQMETLSTTARFRLDLDKIMGELINIVNHFDEVEEVELFIGSSKFTGRKKYEEITRKEIKETILVEEGKI